VRSLSFALLVIFAGSAHAAPVLLNGTAATVGKVLITIHDAYFFGALEAFKRGDPNPLKREEGLELKKIVQKMVFEEMVYAEMKSLQFQEGSRADAIKSVKAGKTKGRAAAWREILSQYGKSESEAIDQMLKSIQVERFIQKKVETLTPIITEGEAERYYKQNASRFGGSAYENLKPSIVVLLKKQHMQKGLEEWVRFLKDKYGVTNLLES